MRVLIITGGTSSERKISLISAKSVKKALEENSYQVKLFDLKKGYKELSQLLPNFDVIFPVIHGEEGEGGGLQEFLLTQGKPFVGGDPKGFEEGWYKVSFKRFCDKNKITTSVWREVKTIGDVKKFGLPSVLKSSTGGSSNEVVILKTNKDLKKQSVQNLISSDLPLLIEKFIKGTEITVGILGDRALPVIEIIPPEGKWYDYRNKYSGATSMIPYAPSLSSKTQQEIQEIALKIHQKLKLGHFSRIDFIVANNQPYALEVNTIPGLTSHSLLPTAAQAAGISFPEMTKRLVEMALNHD